MSISKKLRLIAELERRNNERWREWGEQMAKAASENAEPGRRSEGAQGSA